MVSSICSLSYEKSESEKKLAKAYTQNIAVVAESVCEAPSISILRRSQRLNISETSLRRILHKDLGMTPYKVQLVQELKPMATYRRCWFWQKKIIFSDEAHFYLGGNVYKQNIRIYIEKPRNPKRVTVWCGLWIIGIISRNADVVWPPRSFNFTSLDCYWWGVVKGKC